MPACDAQSLMDLAASRGYGKLSHRQLAECWLVAAANGAPSTAFAYTPATSIITWTDMNGAGQSGDLAFFNANADKPSVTKIDFDAVVQNITSVTNLQNLPALQQFFLQQASNLTILDFSGNAAMTNIQVSQAGSINSLNLTNCTALTSLNCDTNQLVSITGLSTCTALTTFVCSKNLFATLNLNFMPAHIDTLDVSNNPNLTTLTVANLVDSQGSIAVNATGLAHISFPALTGVGLASGGLSASNNNSLLTFSAPVLVNIDPLDNGGGFGCGQNPIMTSITLTNLVFVSGDFEIGNSASLAAFSLPSAGFTCRGTFYVFSCNLLTTLSFGEGATFHETLRGQNNPSLTSVNVSGATFEGFSSPISFNNCPNLTTLTLGTATFLDNTETIDFNGCALAVGDATHGVDGVLNRCVMSTVTTLTIDLSGGTNATPSPAGQADKAILQVQPGNTVTTN